MVSCPNNISLLGTLYCFSLIDFGVFSCSSLVFSYVGKIRLTYMYLLLVAADIIRLLFSGCERALHNF